jgi:L-rhamnose isomerase/sugar isomerase
MRDAFEKQTIDIDSVIGKIQQFTVETPSWGYGNSGTRFKVFPWPGAARNVREKLADAAEVQKVTGVSPSVAIHIPWDWEDDWRAVSSYACSLGLRIGAVNPNLFQKDVYRFGSLCHFDKSIRQQAIEHVVECISIAPIIDENLLR